MKIWLKLVCVNILVVLSLSASVIRSGENPALEYSNFIAADDDNPDLYKLYWSFTDKEITFEVHCQTLGWVGLGISPNGGMNGADIALGWVSNGKPNLIDTHADGASKPKADSIQDWFLISGYEKDGYTVLKMKRNLDTCDKEDRKINTGSVYLIFAWNSKDPSSIENEDWAYHGTSNRRSRKLIVLNYKAESVEEQAQLPENTVTHDFRVNNITVPKKDTYYYCDVFELPKVTEKMHLVQYEILINKAHKNNLHHLNVYECDENFVQTRPLAQECGEVAVPDDVGPYCFSRLIFTWSIGGQVVHEYPKVAGYPFKPSNKTRYALLEVHYDNPDLKEDIVDDSGVRLYVTPVLRKHDIGVLTLTNNLLLIPPSTDNIIMTAVCPSECTNSYIPDEGINVLTGILHTHLAGKSVRTYVVRNGEIVKNLVENPTYDFNYQFAIDIEPYKLQKGDALYTECVYSTKNRKNYTSFGYGVHDEMCFDFLYYYPSMDKMPNCASSTNSYSTYKFFTSLMKDNLIPTYAYSNDENEYVNQYYTVLGTEKILRENVTFTDELLKRFDDFQKERNYISYSCGDKFATIKFEGPFKELEEPSQCTDLDSFAIKEKFNFALGILAIFGHFLF